MFNWTRKLQCAAAVKHQFGLLLMRNRAMKSDMGYDYVLLGYRQKTTLRWSHQGHFKVKLSKIITNIYFYLHTGYQN